MKTVIITGTSNGLGKAFFDIFSKEAVNLICISRRFLEYQKSISESRRPVLLEYDLNDTHSALLDELSSILQGNNSTDDIVFINNAGVIEPMGNIGHLEVEKIRNAVNVNVVSPILILNCLMKVVHKKDRKLQIINITSGAAKHPIAGWGMYCATKAALKMFCDVLNEQCKDNPNVSMCNIDPGVMDTTMQEKIRGINAAEFPSLSYFCELKNSGDLKKSETVAEKIISENIKL